MPGDDSLKLEFDLDPKLVRLVILGILLICGVNYEELMVVVGL